MSVAFEQMKRCRQQRGAIVHVAVESPGAIGSGGQRFTRLDALCGASVRGRSLTFGYLETGWAVNCAECLALVTAGGDK